MGSLDRYTCPACGLTFVSGDNSVGFTSQMFSVWCAFCATVHDFSFGRDQLKLPYLTEQQRLRVGCLKPEHRPYLAWSASQGCPRCGAALERELLLDFD